MLLFGETQCQEQFFIDNTPEITDQKHVESCPKYMVIKKQKIVASQ